jgi:hypothetical protein
LVTLKMPSLTAEWSASLITNETLPINGSDFRDLSAVSYKRAPGIRKSWCTVMKTTHLASCIYHQHRLKNLIAYVSIFRRFAGLAADSAAPGLALECPGELRFFQTFGLQSYESLPPLSTA